MSLYKKNRRKVSKNRKNASGHNTGRSSTKKSRSVKSNSLKQKMKKKRIRITAVAGLAVLLILTIILVVRSCIGERNQFVETDASQPDIDVQLLDVNPYSRPGIESEGVKGVVIHYTANPGSTAQDNRDYFNGLQYSEQTEASSNFIVGLDGEIIQCVPTWEIAYASNERNADTVSIEVCHPDETGKFTDATYRSLVQLTAWLCVKFDLKEDQIIRHYDVTGKNCPKYFVENEDAWEMFKDNVWDAVQKK